MAKYLQGAIRLPRWREVERYVKDPEIVTVEVLFLFLTLCNVFVMYRVLREVAPYPALVTWFQVAQGLAMAYILGELGRAYPKFAYFPQVEVSRSLLRQLFFQSLVYVGMLVLLNQVLATTSSVGCFPLALSFTVVLHHVVRFLGCGEHYMRLRWFSMLLLLAAFLLASSNTRVMNPHVVPYALIYACFSAAFRACYLQKLMHTVNGKGNALHNHQHLIATLSLPIVCLLNGDWHFFTHMPYDFFSSQSVNSTYPTESDPAQILYTWQLWGCLCTAGFLPFLKNIVSNRLIRKTGQGAWRSLEIIAILLVFLVGLILSPSTVFDWEAWVATIFLITGRTLNMYDVLNNMEDAKQSYKASTSNANYHLQGSSDAMSGRVTHANSSCSASQKPFLSSIEENESYFEREDPVQV